MSRTIAIDPGRTNLVTAYDSTSETYKVLSRKGYYQESGILKSNRKTRFWELGLKGATEALSEGSYRSVDEFQRYKYYQAFLRNYSRLWDNKASQKRSRLRFGVYVGKQKCLDRFFENLRGATKDPCIVAYGASSLKPGGKGEMSVPVGRVLKTCQRYFQTSLVNEYLTTKKHHKCCGTMSPVCHKGVEDPRAIRGLYWCPTCITDCP